MTSQQPRPFRHWLLLLALAILYGSAFLGLKIATQSLPAEVVVFQRLAIAVACLAPLAALMRQRVPTDRPTWLSLLSQALIGNALPYFLIAWGQAKVTSSLAGVLMAVTPLAIVVLAHVFLPDERLSRAKIMGFAIGFCGLLVLFVGAGAEANAGGADGFVRALAILAGALCYAVNAILSRKMPALPPVAAGAAVLFTAMVLIAPIGLPATMALPSPVPERAALAVLAVGLFPTALATWVYYELVRTAGASFLALANYLVPIWALFLGATLGNEDIGWRLIAALALVLVGIFIAERGRRA